jgi:hypothetical protein
MQPAGDQVPADIINGRKPAIDVEGLSLTRYG